MTRIQANLLLIVTAAIWGSSFVVQKIAGAHIPATTFTAARFLLGGIAISPLAVLEWRKLVRENRTFSRRDWMFMLLTGCVLCAGAVLQQAGTVETSVTNAGFITCLYVPMVPILALAVQRILPHPVVWPAAALSAFGTYLLSGGGDLSFAPGDLVVLAATIFWAAHVILVGFMSARTGAPMMVSVSQFLIAGGISAVLAPIFETVTLESFQAAWFGIAYMGLISVGIAFTLQSVTQRWTGAADAAIILSSEALFSAIGGAIFLGDRLTPLQMAGCAAILAAILAVQLVPLLRSQTNET